MTNEEGRILEGDWGGRNTGKFHRAGPHLRSSAKILDDSDRFDICRNTEFMDSLFKALNDPTRRRILERLRQHSLTAGELAEDCGVTKPTLSHHLDLLLRAELIEVQKEGQFRRYHLNTSVVEDVALWLGKLLSIPKKQAAPTKLKLQPKRTCPPLSKNFSGPNGGNVC